MLKNIEILENIKYDNNIYYQLNSELFIELLQLAKRGRCAVSLNSKCTRSEYKDYSLLKAWIDTVIPPIINNDNYNYNTKVYWILFGLTTFPRCKTCNKIINRNVKMITYPFYSYCDNYCQITSNEFKVKRKQTWLKKLGVEYPSQSKQVIQTRHKNNLEKYGVNEPSQSSKIKEQTAIKRRLRHNGNWEDLESKIKRNNTNIKKYGNICSLYGDLQQQKTLKTWEKYKNNQPLADPKIRELAKQTCIEKYGKDSYSKTDEFKMLWKDEYWKTNLLAKQHNTKLKNKTFNTSKIEQQALNILLNKYPNIISQYKSKDYPFMCDFYDPINNIYFELNAHWTHGSHFFNPANKDDIEKLNLWNNKAITSKFYKNAIQTWTIRDVEKLKIAKENNLNYIVFWNINDVIQYCKS